MTGKKATGVSLRVTLRLLPSMREDDKWLVEMLQGMSSRQVSGELLNFLRDGIKHQKVVAPLLSGLHLGAMPQLPAAEPAVGADNAVAVDRLATHDLTDIFAPQGT